MSGESPRPGHDQDAQPVTGYDDLLSDLIEQLQRNWEQDDNAANDDLVVQIRERIRSEQGAAKPAGRDSVPDPDEEPIGWDEHAAAVQWLPEHPRAVVDDLGYWSEHGVQVVSIRPRIDGSGAVIGVHRLTNHIITAMRQRYAFPVYCWDAPSPS